VRHGKGEKESGVVVVQELWWHSITVKKNRENGTVLETRQLRPYNIVHKLTNDTSKTKKLAIKSNYDHYVALTHHSVFFLFLI